jgi:uncharacterized protein with NRDE domain
MYFLFILRNRVKYYSNKSKQDDIIVLSNGVTGLSNAELNEYPKVVCGKLEFERIVSTGSDSSELIKSLFGLLADSSDTTGGNTNESPVDPKKPFQLDAHIFIPHYTTRSQDVYGTRTHTVILMDWNDKIWFSERDFDVDSKTWATRSFDFQCEVKKSEPQT